MKINKITSLIFSPTGSSENVANKVMESFSIPSNKIDITTFSMNRGQTVFRDNELVLFASPVYGGRIPSPAINRLSKISGNNTPAILLVTYGNRDYDDALLELKNLVEEKGFIVVAAAAFICEHSIMHSVATNRPDQNDMIKIKLFADQVCNKIELLNDINDINQLEVKGNFPYRIYDGIPLKPKAKNICGECRICAFNCPVNAIPMDDPKRTDEKLCISCMRCIKICAKNARKLNPVVLLGVEKVFAKKNSIRKEPEIFI